MPVQIYKQRQHSHHSTESVPESDFEMYDEQRRRDIAVRAGAASTDAEATLALIDEVLDNPPETD